MSGSGIKLRGYQERGVEELRQAYQSGRRAPLYVLPTGAGKTVVFSHITANAAAKGNQVMILVHRQELLRQSSESLTELGGVDHGLIAPGHTMTADNVQVASVQTLARRLGKVPEPDLIVIDESHHCGAKTWQKIIDAYPNARLLGVTATPCRLDGAGLGVDSGGFFDCMIQGPTIKELIAAGHLVPPRVYAPPSGLDMDGVHSRYGDWVKKELAQAVDKPRITGSAVEHYRKLCPGVPAICFCVSVQHAEHVAEEFRAAGFRAESIDGTMHDAKRKSLIKGLGTGSVQVLASCDIISEGTDIPIVGAAILLRPTQSLGLYLQQVGRALRPADGKTHATILDHVGNCLRHGLPDQVREWDLEAEKRTGTPKDSQDVNIPTRQCEKCFAIHEPAPVCPMCGFEYTAEDAMPEQVDGELQQISEEDAEFMRRAQRRERGYRMSQCETLDDWKALADEWGYKPGWAWFRYRNSKNRAGGRR